MVEEGFVGLMVFVEIGVYLEGWLMFLLFGELK